MDSLDRMGMRFNQREFDRLVRKARAEHKMWKRPHPILMWDLMDRLIRAVYVTCESFHWIASLKSLSEEKTYAKIQAAPPDLGPRGEWNQKGAVDVVIDFRDPLEDMSFHINYTPGSVHLPESRRVEFERFHESLGSAMARATKGWFEGNHIVNASILRVSKGSVREGTGHRAGRPRNGDDDWAYMEVRAKGRKPDEVYKEWLVRIGERKATLADARDSFGKAIKSNRRRGGDVE